MIGKMLSKNVRIMSVYDPTTGTSTSILATATVDMASNNGFEGVMFISTIGNCSTSVSMSIEAATSTTAGDFAALTLNTTAVSVSSTEANRAHVIDCYKPTRRYVRCTWNSTGASNTGGGIVALLYGPRTAPTTNASTDVVSEVHFVST